MCIAVYFRMSSTPGSCKSPQLNRRQEDPNANDMAPPDNPGADNLCSNFQRLNINAEAYTPPPPTPQPQVMTLSPWR